MSLIDQLLAQQKDIEKQLEVAKKQERDAVLKDIKEKIKFFGFKTSDFKGVLMTRKKRDTKTDATKPKAAKPSTKTA
jgi:hypothetical protein